MHCREDDFSNENWFGVIRPKQIQYEVVQQTKGENGFVLSLFSIMKAFGQFK
jgi:hypothetical protein